MTPEIWQRDTLLDLVEHDKIAIKSGHGVGKSAELAWIIIWWITTRYPAKVACTAPTGHQLFDILWSEVAIWMANLPEEMQVQYHITNDRITLKGDDGELKKLTHFAVARTSRKEQPEALQGFHSPNMLFIIDEASGIPENIFEVAEGALSTEGAKIVMTGNPTRVSGYFFEAFQDNTGYWHTRTVSCFDSNRVSRQYIENAKLKYGEDDDRYRVRVLGEFPKQDADSFIKYHLVDAAVNRDVKKRPGQRPIWGLDVARSGHNRSVLVKRHGWVIEEPPIKWRYPNSMELVGAVTKEMEKIDEQEHPEFLFVDGIGMGGPVADRLEEVFDEKGWITQVIAINVSESPSFDPEKYDKTRDELWGKGCDWFESMRGSIPDDEDLVKELTMVKRKFTSSGKEKAEKKEEVQKRFSDPNKSPDVADAFILTMAAEASIGMGFGSSSNWKQPLQVPMGDVA